MVVLVLMLPVVEVVVLVLLVELVAQILVEVVEMAQPRLYQGHQRLMLEVAVEVRTILQHPAQQEQVAVVLVEQEAHLMVEPESQELQTQAEAVEVVVQTDLAETISNLAAQAAPV